tara:strand:+ start:319 stop:615 length:297 start_codon:yes stop_codon:yes gene_type:complete
MKYFNDDIIIYLTKYITPNEYNRLSLCSSNIKKIFDQNQNTVLTNITNNIENFSLIENNNYYTLKIIKNNNTFVGNAPKNICLKNYIKYFLNKYLVEN